MDHTDTFSKGAPGLAERGLEVFPVHTVDDDGACSCGRRDCGSPGKHPVLNWKEGATSDLLEIEGLADRFPSMNVGLATGARSGVFVLDVDVADGKEGENTLEALEREHGPLPETVTAQTGGGGRHLYFEHPGRPVKNSAGKLGPGLDVRGDGGYVVAPPGRHASGGRYEWAPGLSPHDVEVAEAPQWLIEMVTEPARRPGPPRAPLTGALSFGDPKVLREGTRNDGLFRYACRLRSEGQKEVEIRAAIDVRNEGFCRPPLGDDELDQIAIQASLYDPDAAGPKLTDLGNAERFVAEHGRLVRYDVSAGRWLLYTGGVWRPSREGVQRLVKRTVRGLASAAESARTEGERAAVLKHARRSESRSGLDNALVVAQSEPGVPVYADDLDVDPWVLNVPNGTVDLKTGRLREHRPDDLLTQMASFDFDPSARSPLFDRFIDEVTVGDKDLAGFLKRAVGYSATGRVDEQALFFMFGGGANGKSVFVEVLMHVLGSYSQKAPTSMLTVKRGDSIPTDIARLRGARFVVVAEAQEGVALDEAVVKDVTGGDRLAARFMRQDFFEFAPTHTIWAYGNHRPLVRGTDDGVWRRLQFVPFNASIPPAQRDAGLKEKLLREGPGILRWVVEGCLEWQKHGLNPPTSVTKLSQGYRGEMNQVKRFVDETCDRALGSRVEMNKLYKTYVAWCADSGEGHVPKTTFGRKLSELDVPSSRTGKARYRGGIKLSASAPNVL